MEKSKTSFSRYLTLNIVLCIIVVFLCGLQFYDNDKVAYVDSAKLLREFKGAITARKGYEVKLQAWQTRIDTLSLEVQNALKAYEKDLVNMSVKEQKLSEQLISSKQKQFADYQKAVQENAQQEDEKLTREIVSQVNEFLLRYGKRNNYKIIFIANQSGTIAYAREGLDITEDVVKKINEEYGPH